MPEFPEPPDLTDPAQLVAQCLTLAESMDAQSAVHSMRGGMGSHPDPVFLYAQAAAALRAAAARIVPPVVAEVKTEAKVESKPEPKSKKEAPTG